MPVLHNSHQASDLSEPAIASALNSAPAGGVPGPKENSKQAIMMAVACKVKPRKFTCRITKRPYGRSDFEQDPTELKHGFVAFDIS